MAVDYGDAHTGLACCDRTQTLASPIGVIDERNFQTCVEKVAAAAVEYEVGEVVVGNPINMNGTYGPRSEKCRMFADMLQNFLEIPVVMWDERSTTVTAHNMMNDVNKRGKERKKVIDAVAAAVILQNYLDYKGCGHINPQRLLLKLVNYLHLRLKSAEVLIQHINSLLQQFITDTAE